MPLTHDARHLVQSIVQGHKAFREAINDGGVVAIGGFLAERSSLDVVKTGNQKPALSKLVQIPIRDAMRDIVSSASPPTAPVENCLNLWGKLEVAPLM